MNDRRIFGFTLATWGWLIVIGIIGNFMLECAHRDNCSAIYDDGSITSYIEAGCSFDR